MNSPTAHLESPEGGGSHSQKTQCRTAEGSPVDRSSVLSPRPAEAPTCGWWRTPASPRLWRGRLQGGARRTRLQTWDPARRTPAGQITEETGEVEKDKRDGPTCEVSDNGDFFGDLFTLKVLLRNKNIYGHVLNSRINLVPEMDVSV